MKKILHMTPPIVNNGIYKYIFSNLKYIDKSKYEFAFLTQANADLKATEEYQKYGFQIHNFTTTQRENSKLFRQQIVDILLSGYDVLHLHTSFWRGFLIEEIAMEMGVPKVIVHSSSIDIINPTKREQMYEEHLKLKSQFNKGHATDFWACSELAADWLYGEHIPRDEVKIMRNAIEVERFSYNEEIRKQYRKALGIDGKFVIGNTCRFEYQKNHEFLIRVFAKVHEKHPETVLFLAGGGQNLLTIKKLVKDFGIEDAVCFLGWRDDVEKIYQVMDLYCLPSLFEGLPIVLVEAQASGLKCLVSSTITREAKITDDVYYIDLIEKEWIGAIEQFLGNANCRQAENKVKGTLFDIKKQIKVIEAEYAK